MLAEATKDIRARALLSGLSVLDSAEIMTAGSQAYHECCLGGRSSYFAVAQRLSKKLHLSVVLQNVPTLDIALYVCMCVKECVNVHRN